MAPTSLIDPMMAPTPRPSDKATRAQKPRVLTLLAHHNRQRHLWQTLSSSWDSNVFIWSQRRKKVMGMMVKMAPPRERCPNDQSDCLKLDLYYVNESCSNGQNVDINLLSACCTLHSISNDPNCPSLIIVSSVRRRTSVFALWSRRREQQWRCMSYRTRPNESIIRSIQQYLKLQELKKDFVSMITFSFVNNNMHWVHLHLPN
jgi:hypothetical protein